MELTRPRAREGSIVPVDGVVTDLGTRLQLQGYEELAVRTLLGLLILQDGSERRETEDHKFARRTQFLRLVGAPGTGKTTTLQEVYHYIYEHFDRLVTLLIASGQLPTAAVAAMKMRVENCLCPERFLSFTFSNASCRRLLPAEERKTASFMAIRMLHAMVGGFDGVTRNYESFVTNLDASLRKALVPIHLVDFLQAETGLGTVLGMVAFNFDECGAPEPEAEGRATYFQHGLSSLVDWRKEEAERCLGIGGSTRNMLPVVVIAGSHAHKMTLLQTASGRAQLFNLRGAVLTDAALHRAGMDVIQRIGSGCDREVPETAAAVLDLVIPWLGWNPRLLHNLLCVAGSKGITTPRQGDVNVDALWSFLSLREDSREDKVFSVLGQLESMVHASNWDAWMHGDARKRALCLGAFAHTITGRPVARRDEISGADTTWSDAENLGFVALYDSSQLAEQAPAAQVEAAAGGYEGSQPLLSGEDMSTAAALDLTEGQINPDSQQRLQVLLPPLLLRYMYTSRSHDWPLVHSLFQLIEHWQNREQSDVGLLVVRLKLWREVFQKVSLPLESLCPGLNYLGDVWIPVDDYNIHRMVRQLDAAGFKRECIDVATTDANWAWLGPGNWGPDGWLILYSCSADGKRVILYIQSKLRRDITHLYPKGDLSKEAAKCWEVEPPHGGGLLYYTDERGRGCDLEPLDTPSGMMAVAVSRDARVPAYGMGMALLKRGTEAIMSGQKRTRH